MRITNEYFDKKAIYHNGKHFFPYPDDVSILDGKLSIQICFYTPIRNKWHQGSYYTDNVSFIKQLFQFAIRHKLIQDHPEAVKEFLSGKKKLNQ